MNYKAHHDRLIERAKTRVVEGYTEKHHIIPRCMGGENESKNLVKLYPEEHCIAHLLLVKIHPGNYKLVFAANRITKKHKINNKEYGWLKRKHSIALSSRIVSEETKQKQSISQTGKVLSEETRKRISEAEKGRIFSEEHQIK